MFFLIKFYVFFDRQFPCYKTNCSIFEQFNSILSQQKDSNIYVLIHVLHNIILFFLGVGALLFRFLFVCLFGFVGWFFFFFVYIVEPFLLYPEKFASHFSECYHMLTSMFVFCNLISWVSLTLKSSTTMTLVIDKFSYKFYIISFLVIH